MRKEEFLIHEVISGNKDAFYKLWDMHEKMVLRLLSNMSVQEDDVQDVLQDAALKVFRGLPDFRFQSSLSSWIYRIASNAACDMLNLRRREAAALIHPAGVQDADNGARALEELLQIPDEDRPDECWKRREVRERILTVMKCYLNNMEYLAILLVHFEEWDMAEAAREIYQGKTQPFRCFLNRTEKKLARHLAAELGFVGNTYAAYQELRESVRIESL